MTHRSRTRWVIAGLALLGLLSGGLLLSTATQRETEPVSSSETLPSRTDPATAGDAKDRPRRKHDTGAAADAKLRSLLEVREGEISCIRIPADLMAGFPLVLEGDAIIGGADLPALLGIISRPAVLDGLKDLGSKGRSIEGSVDGDSEAFEWSGNRISVSGTTLTGSHSVSLKIEAREGEKQLEVLTTLPPGGIVFLRSSQPNPEGILLVVGQRATEKPEFEKTDR